MLDWIKTKLTELEGEVAKYNNAGFLDAVVAASVIVAAADGEITPDEKTKMLKFVQTNSLLKAFNTQAVIRSFNRFAESYEFDRGIGFDEAIKAVRSVTDADQRRLLIRVAVAIARANGTIEASEEAVIRKLCSELGQNPSEFLA